MNYDDYEKNYLGIYAEFSAFIRKLLKDTITETKWIPRLQSTKSRAKSVASLNGKRGQV